MFLNTYISNTAFVNCLHRNHFAMDSLLDLPCATRQLLRDRKEHLSEMPYFQDTSFSGPWQGSAKIQNGCCAYIDATSKHCWCGQNSTWLSGFVINSSVHHQCSGVKSVRLSGQLAPEVMRSDEKCCPSPEWNSCDAMTGDYLTNGCSNLMDSPGWKPYRNYN